LLLCRSERPRGRKPDERIAGIEAADKAAATVYELAALEKMDGKDARQAIQLAKQGIDLAHERAKRLGGMKTLSDDARSEANTLTVRLDDARTTVQQLDKESARHHSPRRHGADPRAGAELHDTLTEAERAAERIARAYDVSTDLEFGG
jgi:hypothetical protein